MKRFLSLIIRRLSVFFVEMFYTDIWNLRERLEKKRSKLLAQMYYGYLEHYGAWIGLGAKIEGKPILPHGLFGIFISNSAHIGKNVVIYHQVTIGSNMTVGGGKNGAPTIGDNVFIGCGAKLIGDVHVGVNARIGANCIVVKDVPANSLAVTKGTVVIERKEIMDNTYIANSYL